MKMTIEQFKAVIREADDIWALRAELSHIPGNHDLVWAINGIADSGKTNAFDTCEETGTPVMDGNDYSEDFYGHWYGSMQCLLCSPDDYPAGTAEWYAERGIKA